MMALSDLMEELDLTEEKMEKQVETAKKRSQDLRAEMHEVESVKKQLEDAVDEREKQVRIDVSGTDCFFIIIIIGLIFQHVKSGDFYCQIHSPY